MTHVRTLFLSLVAVLIFASGCAQIQGAYTDAYRREGDAIYAKSNNYAEAARFYQMGAEKGSSDAAYSLGRMYIDGLVPGGAMQGVDWLRKAASAGHVRASRDLGAANLYGFYGLNSDVYAAIPLLEKAAAANDGTALFQLGMVYSGRFAVPKNPELAASYFRRAAQAGMPVPAKAQDASAMATVKPTKFKGGSHNTKAQIWEAQCLLNSLGYNTGKPDGVAGAKTLQALRECQEKNGLPVTGTVTGEAVRALRHATSPSRRF